MFNWYLFLHLTLFKFLRFHPDEDEMILNHLEHNPNLDEKRKYSDLAKVLKRTRVSIWRRYRLLKKNRRMQS